MIDYASFFDELEKIARMVGMETEIQRAGGRMTPEAYAAGRESWQKQQAIKKQLKPRLAAHRKLQSRVAKKVVKPGLLGRIGRLVARAA